MRVAGLASIVIVALSAPCARAQHFDVLVQSVNGKLTTGAANFDDGSDALGLRVFSRPFNSFFAISDPGFNAIGSSAGTLPAGSDALPGNSPLRWDFLPMKVNGLVSNLLFWNGAGTTPDSVAFGLPPAPTYSLSLFGENDLRAAADGSERLVNGHVIDSTAPDGFIHEHRFFFLDNDNNDDNATVAVSGVYMASLRLRMNQFNRSEPIFLLFSAPGVSSASLSAADQWVRENVNALAPSFSSDFDGDLDVDGADFLTWQRGLGPAPALQMQGDADGDRRVGAADLAAWQEEFGQNVATIPGALANTLGSISSQIPEPTALCLSLGLFAGLASNSRRL